MDPPSVLLSSISEIANDTVHVLVRGHDHVYRVEARLRLAVVRDRLDDWMYNYSDPRIQ